MTTARYRVIAMVTHSWSVTKLVVRNSLNKGIFIGRPATKPLMSPQAWACVPYNCIHSSR